LGLVQALKIMEVEWRSRNWRTWPNGSAAPHTAPLLHLHASSTSLSPSNATQNPLSCLSLSPLVFYEVPSLELQCRNLPFLTEVQLRRRQRRRRRPRFWIWLRRKQRLEEEEEEEAVVVRRVLFLARDGGSVWWDLRGSHWQFLDFQGRILILNPSLFNKKLILLARFCYFKRMNGSFSCELLVDSLYAWIPFLTLKI
jgi:hypothetical protein